MSTLPNNLKSRAEKVQVGDRAPDFSVTDSEGHNFMLSRTWANKPVVVVFLRHFGCTFCREQVALIRREYQKLVAAGVDVVCIGNGPYKVGKAFEIFFALPFPVIVCADSAPFALYGLERVTLFTLLSPRVIWKGFLALLSGHYQGRITSDPYQLPGTFLVDTQGIIRFVHRNKDAADHTNVADIIAAARSL